jgi:hypothetical protein
MPSLPAIAVPVQCLSLERKTRNFGYYFATRFLISLPGKSAKRQLTAKSYEPFPFAKMAPNSPSASPLIPSVK